MYESVVRTVVDNVVRQLEGGMSDMTLESAISLAAEVRKKAAEMGIKIVVAISNKAARPILVECEDDSYIASYDIAVQKAYTAVAVKMSTLTLKPLAQPGGPLYGIQFTNDGQIVVFGGGEPLKNANGVIVGGLGVSGGSEEQDAVLAAYGKELFERNGGK
jgi:uncharacterized protein GlcG (DUF336 family)